MSQKLNLTTCSLFTTSIFCSIFALSSQPGFAALSSFRSSNQTKALPNILFNTQKHDSPPITVAKPGKDGQ